MKWINACLGDSIGEHATEMYHQADHEIIVSRFDRVTIVMLSNGDKSPLAQLIRHLITRPPKERAEREESP